MITHRGVRAAVVVAVAIFISPTQVQAGPLFDWLFQRNRSQNISAGYPPNSGYNAGYTAGYGGSNAGYGGGNVGYTTNYRGPGQPACGSCLANLFSRNRGNGLAANYPNAPATPNNAYAASSAYAQTAGYAPQGGCAAGWCRQTVVRWVPQTAYRTDYQRVPMTTYRTSTSINPANGLPLTCTRPCTTYTMQPRRVPVTTYRPMYTTVPVTDPLAQQQAPMPTNVGYPPRNYAFQPPAPTGCATCQNGGAALTNPAYGNWSNVPGYTPGNATQLPPAVAPRPWSDVPGGDPSRLLSGNDYGANATWQSESRDGWQDTGRSLQTPGGRGYDGNWRTLGPEGGSPPPASQPGTAPADTRPRLNRPIYPDELDRNDTLSGEQVPDYLRRRISTQNQLVPRDRPEATSGYRGYEGSDRLAGDGYQSRDPYEGYGNLDQLEDRSSREASSMAETNSPDLSAPSNQPATTEQRPIRGIPNRRRIPAVFETPGGFDDRTAEAERREPRGSRPVIEGSSRTRYAATPIEYTRRNARPAPRRDQQQEFDWQKQASRRRRNEPTSVWSPVR